MTSQLSSHLLHHLIEASAVQQADAPALTFGAQTLSYGELARDIQGFASGLQALGLHRAERVGIYLDKRIETVTAFFGTSAAGGV